MFRGLGLGFHQAHWSVGTQLSTQWGLFTACKGASMPFPLPSLLLLPCNLPYIPSLPITLAYLPYRILHRIAGRRQNISARERNSGERLVTETKSCHVFTIFRIVILWCKFFFSISSSLLIIFIINFYRWLRKQNQYTQQRFFLKHGEEGWSWLTTWVSELPSWTESIPM